MTRAINAPTVCPYGSAAFEVVADGRQVGRFYAKTESRFDQANGRHVEVEPTVEALDEARRMAGLFCSALASLASPKQPLKGE